MPFARSFDKVFKVYRETCESMGVYAYRVDNAVTIDILKNTFDGLKNNDFVIADISNNNCNNIRKYDLFIIPDTPSWKIK